MIIGIEGHSFTGKTTTLDAIRGNSAVTVIPETDHYAGGIDQYPPFPPLDQDMSRTNVDFFANLERARKADADAADGDIVTDRTFVSVLLFQKFLRQLDNEWVDALDYGKSLYHDRIDADEVIIPDMMTVLTCASDAEYMSRIGREVSVGELRTLDAYRFFTDEYLRIFEPYQKLGRLAVLINSNSTSPEMLADNVVGVGADELTSSQKITLAHEVVGGI